MVVNNTKLDKKEWQICHKVFKKMSKFNGQTASDRENAVKFLQSELSKKLKVNIGEIKEYGNRYLGCLVNIGDEEKTCYLLFDKLAPVNPLLIPSGVFEFNDSSSLQYNA